jgi:Amt family ammonium transporter
MQTSLNLLLAFLLPIAVLLLALGAFEERRLGHAAAAAMIGVAVALLTYALVGFAFQFGGIGLVNPAPGLRDLTREWSPLDVMVGPGWGVIGLEGFAAVLQSPNADIMALFLYNAALGGTAMLIPMLAVARRVRSRRVVIAGLLLGGLIYPLAANWVWGGGWLSQMGNASGLGHGVVDFAGSGIVFMFGGFAALGALLGSGLRKHTQVTTAANIPEFPRAQLPLLMILGSFLVLVGLGSAATGDPFPFKNLPATLIVFNLVSAMLAGILVATLYGWFVSGEPLAMLAARGAVAAMVAVAASLPFIQTVGALAIGAIAGLLLPLSAFVVDRWLRVDDEGLVVSTFGAAGAWGLVALAVFADGSYGVGWNGTGVKEYLGVANQGVTGIFALQHFVPDSPGQMEAQFFGIIAIGLFAFVVSWLLFFLLRPLGKVQTAE